MNLNKKQQEAIVMDYALTCVKQEPEDLMIGHLADIHDRPSKSLDAWTLEEAKQLNRRVYAFIERHGFKCSELTPLLRVLANWYGLKEVESWFYKQTETA
jgi:hypothetical protein